MANITKELREWASVEVPYKYGHQLNAIADRIDAEHERLMQEQPYTIDMVPMTDEHMAKHGWVKLPVDANGEVIHIGDVLDPPADCDDYMPLQVVRLTYDGYEEEWFFDGDVGGFTGMVGKCMDVAGWTHHHHATSVEDVLREMLYKAHIYDEQEMELLPDLITEYAVKLRLADNE